jgi:hypothetical protein
MNNSIPLILISLLSYLMPVIGNSQANQMDKSKSFSIHVIKGYHIYELRFINDHEISNFGVETQLTFHKGAQWGIQLKANWLKWTDSRETYFPLLLGPEFSMPLSGKLEMVMYGNAGPTVLIGNDYGSVFGSAETGVQFSSSNKKGVLLGLAWSQNLIFHPSHFSFLKGLVGWRF